MKNRLRTGSLRQGPKQFRERCRPLQLKASTTQPDLSSSFSDPTCHEEPIDPIDHIYKESLLE